MGNVARLFVEAGTLTLDADVPYDRQLVFEYADRYARRQGSIEMDLDGVQWTVSASVPRAPRCTNCGRRVHSLSYSDQRHSLCPRCARALCLVPHLHHVAGRKPPGRKAGLPLGSGSRRPRATP